MWSATFLHRTTTSERSFESSRLGEFQCKISPGYDLRQKSYGFRQFRCKGRLSIQAWDHPQKVWTATFLGRNSTSRTALESFPSRTLKYGVSAGLPKRLKNHSSFNLLVENSEKYRSTELYGAALEGSTSFLCRSSLGCTSMENWNMHFSAAQDVRLKNYIDRSSFYRWSLSMGL